MHRKAASHMDHEMGRNRFFLLTEWTCVRKYGDLNARAIY